MPLFSFSGQRPTDLGVIDGKLKPCPNTPNCVCSDDPDTEHQIAPIAFSGAPQEAIAKLKGIVESMERSNIVAATDTYLQAEFFSPTMGFGDDVEFYASAEEQLVHVRSAARLGRSDLGVNRKRVEAIRSQFA